MDSLQTELVDRTKETRALEKTGRQFTADSFLHCSGVTYQRALIIAPDVGNKWLVSKGLYIKVFFVFLLFVHKSCYNSKTIIKLFLYSAYLRCSNIIKIFSCLFVCLFWKGVGYYYIHLSIHFLFLPLMICSWEALEPIPAVLGVKAG